MMNRNHFFDLVKTFLCIGVVFVHFPIQNVFGKCLSAFGILAVQFFFLISGWSCYGEDENFSDKIILKAKKILRLAFLSVAFYAFFSAVLGIFIYPDLLWFKNLTRPAFFLEIFLVGNYDAFLAPHLWFLTALFYGYLAMHFVEKYRSDVLSAILFILFLVVRCITETCTNSFGANWHWSGNFLLGGLPLLLTGYFLHSKKEKLMMVKLHAYIIFASVSFFCMFLTANVKFFGQDFSHYFKLTTGVLIFLLGIKLEKKICDNPLSWFGKNCSLFVYVFHYMVGVLFFCVMEKFKFSDFAFAYVLPCGTVVVTCLMSFMIYEIGKLMGCLKKKIDLA